MRQLPPHPDTRAALYALTNNPLPVVQAQLEHVGLSDLSTGVLSGDTSRPSSRGAPPTCTASRRRG
jgi:hypothetical protein